ncbi:hypothetical protein, partial [Cupriavidus oxalaticus]|uniref:hypothetical protein n=1 Tax=Cupriavidus oxalaticus TaxID=96344 RepID=UPI00316E34F0
KQSPVRKPRHTTIRVAARRAVNALFGDFLSLGQKVTRPSGRNPGISNIRQMPSRNAKRK